MQWHCIACVLWVICSAHTTCTVEHRQPQFCLWTGHGVMEITVHRTWSLCPVCVGSTGPFFDTLCYVECANGWAACVGGRRLDRPVLQWPLIPRPCHPFLQVCSVGETPCQSVESQLGAFSPGAVVGGDGGAVDSPTQGAVQGMDMRVEA